jgi:hypothetical protein
MALLTASTAAFGAVFVLHGIPSSRMGADHETGPRTVTGHAHISIAVAGLACLQVPAGLTGVVCGPLMLGEQPSGMARLTLRGRERGMGGAACSCSQVRPALPV